MITAGMRRKARHRAEPEEFSCSTYARQLASDMRGFRFIIALSLLVLGGSLQVRAQASAPVEQGPDPRNSICAIIESAARANALPVDFFARVIWQESRLRPDVIGPVTRSGERAQGIAQFMPGTASERRLYEPFNPIEALPKSGKFLAELRDQFGNLGLAAAAYNAGPQRVREFIAGARDLPAESRNYVLAITGRSVDDWAKPGKELTNEGEKDGSHGDRAPANCRGLVAFLERSSKPLVAQMSNVPSWCRYLHHPNLSVCGSIHEFGSAMKFSSLAKPRGHVTHLRTSSR
jgi:hypothetical protein